MIKAESALVNTELGVLAEPIATAIHQAADEIVAGDMADQFPVDVFQTGSGTSTNMNLNEVIANRASEILGATVHPNDHVNASQSSNDTFPSAVRIAAVLQLETTLLPALAALHASLSDLADRHIEHHQDGQNASDGRGADHVRTGGQWMGPQRRIVDRTHRIAAAAPDRTAPRRNRRRDRSQRTSTSSVRSSPSG